MMPSRRTIIKLWLSSILLRHPLHSSNRRYRLSCSSIDRNPLPSSARIDRQNAIRTVRYPSPHSARFPQLRQTYHSVHPLTNRNSTLNPKTNLSSMIQLQLKLLRQRLPRRRRPFACSTTLPRKKRIDGPWSLRFCRWCLYVSFLSPPNTKLFLGDLVTDWCY